MGRRVQGLTAKGRGEAFERMIDHSCAIYAKQKIALIEKTPEAMKVVKRNADGKTFTAVFEKKSQVDYKGLLNTGRAVAFDAKHTSDKKFNISRVEEHQRKMLRDVAEMGGIAFVLVSIEFKRFYRLPIEWIEQKFSSETKRTYTEEELWGFAVPSAGYRIDFLADEMGASNEKG